MYRKGYDDMEDIVVAGSIFYDLQLMKDER